MERYIIGKKVADIETPALLIDLDKMEYNLDRMANFIKGKKTSIRPHFKTHKSLFLAHKQIEAGAIGITCQKLSEAEVLAKSGIRDILISNEIVGKQKIKRLINLAAYTDLIVCIDNYHNAEDISNYALEKGVVISYLVELNIGMNRCGVEPGETALKLVQKINDLKGLKFLGIMAYEGHTVFIESYEERQKETIEALKKVSETKQILKREGITCQIVSCGGTGTYMITGAYLDVTEIEAGSYLTMDTKYNTIQGVGEKFKTALSLLTTVISVPTDDRIILDAGMKAISKEFGMPLLRDSVDGVELYKLSEEHGIVKVPVSVKNLFSIGQKIELLPSHGCTTINLHDIYYGIRSGIVECVLPIEGRGKFY
jgi:D-serine deaminase-like pyridoxal phosphate-dependent protein